MYSEIFSSHFAVPASCATLRGKSLLSGAVALLLALSAAGAAQAAALADVQLVERNSGQRLTIYEHQGEYWVAGRPGANYSIDIKNRTGRRILAVISVDGVNVLNGRTASATPDDGYVFSPWQNWKITGWRKSDSQVAAFYFSESDASYAARTGRPRDVGVIGVAVFRERMPEPVRPAPPVSRQSPRMDERKSSSAADRSFEPPVEVAPQASPAAPAAEAESMTAKPNADASASASANMTAKRAPSAAPASPTLGTGHGALEQSYTQTTEFNSATSYPEQVVRIRYDSYANLVAKGVIREPRPDRRPNAFPAGGGNGYVPDPPRW